MQLLLLLWVLRTNRETRAYDNDAGHEAPLGLLTMRGIARRNLVPQIWFEVNPFMARSTAHAAMTTGRYLYSSQ